MTLKLNKSKTYWTKRQLAHEEERYKGAEAFIDEAVRVYEGIMAKLEEAISARLVAISDNNGVSMTEAMRRLSNKELAGWRMSLKEFIKLSERGNLPEDLEQALLNASHRIHLSQLEAMKTLIDTSIRVENYNLNVDLTTFLSEEWQKIINASVVKDKNKIGVGYSKEALDVVLSKPWAQDGRTFSKRIWEDGQKTSRRLQDNLEQNILIGKHPHDIIQDMQKVLPKNKRSDIARLVHTEHAYVASEADKVAFEALELEKYEICAVLDSKTSALCRSLDGKVFDLKGRKIGINAPPFHPNCRTVTVPYFEDEDDGKERRVIDTDNLQNYKEVTYGQSEKRKRSAVALSGRTIESSKHDLWVSDKVKFSRRSQHILEKELTKALDGVPQVKGAIRPEVLVLDPIEMAKPVSAAYNPVSNTLYINAAIFNKETRQSLEDSFVGGNDISTTFYHECLHWSDAWAHKAKGHKITAGNYNAYINMLNARAKRKLDKLGVTGDNVGEIGVYAKNSYKNKVYNETYTEYRVKEKFRKG